MTRLWLGFALLIAYGSVYPFDFQPGGLDATSIQAFLATCCRATSRGDILGNVLLFLPFGYLGTAAARPGASLSERVLLVVLLGLLLALALQVAQIYLPSRNANLQDVGWNGIGAFAGAVLGAVTHRHLQGAAGRIAGAAIVPLLLVIAWLVYRLIPFVPSIDFASIKDSIKPILQGPGLDYLDTFHDTVAWLVVAYLMQRLRPNGALDRYIPALMIATFLLETLIVSNTVHRATLAGAVLAVFLWRAVLRNANARVLVLTTLLCILLAVSGLEPFALNAQAASFNWLPFHGLLGGSMYLNALSVSEKVFLYGSLVYLAWEAGLGRVVGTVLAAVFVLLIELAQTFISGHVPEVTDPLLVVLAALVLNALRRRAYAGTGTGGAWAGRRKTAGGEPHTSSADAGDELTAVTVNLRWRTIALLDRLSQSFGHDTSVVCRHILDIELPEMQQRDDSDGARAALVSLRDAILQRLPADDAPQAGAGGAAETWAKRTIVLRRDQAEAVRRRAEQHGASASRTIRHALDDFLTGATRQSAAMARVSPALHTRPNRPPEASPGGHPRPSQSAKSRRRWQFVVVASAVVATSVVLAFGEAPIDRGPAIVAAAPWAGRDAEIILDHHSHTRHSDGALTMAELVALARESGCDALAITDHSDAPATADNQQLEELRRLRRENPGFLLFGGIEINMPSYEHREHANVIVDPSREGEILKRLRDAAEKGVKQVGGGADGRVVDREFLALVTSFMGGGDDLVMIYNHPSRKDPDPSENYADIVRWNAVGKEAVFIGFEGAPGHQNAAEPGDYGGPIFTLDRWDPVAGEVGGTWDRLLSEGVQIWAAIAGSDFHSHQLDKAPCSFARTHVAAAEFSYPAVLRALRAGTFWADHGRILTQLSFSAEVSGMGSRAYPGSIVALAGENEPIVARVDIERGPGSINQPLEVEFIGNCRTGQTEVLATEWLRPHFTTVAISVEPRSAGADQKSCFLRVRVRLENGVDPDLMAYSNPIRFRLD